MASAAPPSLVAPPLSDPAGHATTHGGPHVNDTLSRLRTGSQSGAASASALLIPGAVPSTVAALAPDDPRPPPPNDPRWSGPATTVSPVAPFTPAGPPLFPDAAVDLFAASTTLVRAVPSEWMAGISAIRRTTMTNVRYGRFRRNKLQVIADPPVSRVYRSAVRSIPALVHAPASACICGQYR